jgi:hypothetical protein
MSDVVASREKLLNVLVQISAGSSEEQTADLRAALLDFASETPDNRNCADRLEVGASGLRFANQSLSLCDLAHAVEDLPMPEEIKDACPHICERDWDAFTRLTTLIYTLLSPNVSRANGS